MICRSKLVSIALFVCVISTMSNAGIFSALWSKTLKPYPVIKEGQLPGKFFAIPKKKFEELFKNVDLGEGCNSKGRFVKINNEDDAWQLFKLIKEGEEVIGTVDTFRIGVFRSVDGKKDLFPLYQGKPIKLEEGSIPGFYNIFIKRNVFRGDFFPADDTKSQEGRLYESAEGVRDWEIETCKQAGDKGIKLRYKKFTINNPYLANTMWYSMLAAGVASLSYGVHKVSKKETRKKMKEAMHNVVKRFSKQVEKHANKLNPSVSMKAPRVTY